jgi:hypothetical protein
MGWADFVESLQIAGDPFDTNVVILQFHENTFDNQAVHRRSTAESDLGASAAAITHRSKGRCTMVAISPNRYDLRMAGP